MTALRRRLRALSGSIKTRVTLAAVAALALGIGLTTLILVTAAERATLATERDRELQEGVRTAAILTHRVVDLQRALQATASTLDEPTLRDRVRLAAFMDSKPVLRGLFSSLFVAAPDGRLLTLVGADGARASRLSVSDRPYFTRTVAEQRPIVSEPVASRADGKPVVVLTYPLRNAHGVYGVLAGVLDLRRRNLLQDLVDDPDDADDGTSTLVVVTDARGRVLAHPNRERLMQPIADEPRMADGYARWLAEGGASGGAVEPSGLRLPQAGQVLIVAGVPGPDWLVWRATPQAALLAPLRAARHKALRWASVIVAGASLFLLATLGWLLRPLSLLEARAMHLFDDDAPVHAGWPEVGGEIGALARVLRHVGAERAQLEQFNAQVLVKLRSVMTAAPIGILFTRDDQFELVSAHLGTLLGRDEQALLGRPVASIFALPDDHARLGPLVAEAWADARPYLGEWRFLRADGSAFWGQLRGLPVEPGHPDAGTIWTLSDISDQVAEREKLEWSAHHDALTGLANRKLFERRAAQILAGRGGAAAAALVMVDLDRFKPINDTEGHAAGDAMLVRVARAIDACVRGSDLVARLGGDEFAILLEHCPRHAAERIAGELQRAVAEARLDWRGKSLAVGASIGVALLGPELPDLAAWLHEADSACYAAKAAGRGLVQVAGTRAPTVFGPGA